MIGVTHTDFLIRMSGLIPNGVYSLFYRTFNPDSNNAYCPDVEPTLALTSAFRQLQKPDPDPFIAAVRAKRCSSAAWPETYWPQHSSRSTSSITSTDRRTGLSPTRPRPRAPSPASADCAAQAIGSTQCASSSSSRSKHLIATADGVRTVYRHAGVNGTGHNTSMAIPVLSRSREFVCSRRFAVRR